MLGPEVIAATLSVAVPDKKYGNRWQYHPRSDRHSKVCCWAILLDLLNECSGLRRQARAGKVCFGINHELTAYKTQKTKSLDFVICVPGTRTRPSRYSFKGLASSYSLKLTQTAEEALDKLPTLQEAPTGQVLLTLEAKACMTSHVKAIPRLHSELNDSHQIVHDSAPNAIAGGFVLVNAANRFASPTQHANMRKILGPGDLDYTIHPQPRVTAKVIEKLQQLPRRNGPIEGGFDSIGIMTVKCENNDKPISVETGPPALRPDHSFHYDQMIRRLCQRYSQEFGNL